MGAHSEDQLARLAFGDLSDAESVALESQASLDPHLQKTLSEYRSIREGLRSLANVPDHQLSNERLRDAILGTGLRPKPVRTMDFSWLWMSGAAAALAVGLMVILHRGRSMNPELVGLDNPMGLAASTPFSSNPFASTSSTGAMVAKVRAPKKIEQPAHSVLVALLPAPHVRHHRLHRTHDVSNDGLLATIFSGDTSTVNTKEAPVATSQIPSGSTPAGLTTADLKPVDNNPAPSVVVIEPDKDQNTGAQRATEIGTPSNVVVGG